MVKVICPQHTASWVKLSAQQWRDSASPAPPAPKGQTFVQCSALLLLPLYYVWPLHTIPPNPPTDSAEFGKRLSTTSTGATGRGAKEFRNSAFPSVPGAIDTIPTRQKSSTQRLSVTYARSCAQLMIFATFYPCVSLSSALPRLAIRSISVSFPFSLSHRLFFPSSTLPSLKLLAVSSPPFLSLSFSLGCRVSLAAAARGRPHGRGKEGNGAGGPGHWLSHAPSPRAGLASLQHEASLWRPP